MKAVASMKHSRKISNALVVNWTQTMMILVRDQCSNHWVRVGSLMQLSEIDYTVKSQLSECRLFETTGLFEDDGQSRLFLYYLLQ